jgi:hypothetical protein
MARDPALTLAGGGNRRSAAGTGEREAIRRHGELEAFFDGD